jgi:signal transduction histidine kinase
MNQSFLILCYFMAILSTQAAPIRITKLSVIPKKTILDKRIVAYKKIPGNGITLPYSHNDFIIYYSTLTFPPPYQYRLKDWNVDYHSETANKYVFFTNIPSGNYTFTIWSTSHKKSSLVSMIIRIEAPLWLQWWFLPMLFLYALILMGIIFYIVYRYRIRQLMRLHALRENIARDLHDDMGSYLSSISILSQNAITLTDTEPQTVLALTQKIGEIARQVMDSMGDIIWSVNPENDSMNQIVVRMRDVGADLLEELDIKFNLKLDESVLLNYIPIEHRRDFFLIYKESLNNIVKHAKANNVYVELSKLEALLILTIQDDGIGFDNAKHLQKNLMGGNGIKNIISRAKNIGGDLEIVSTDIGTMVILRIPLV